MSSPPAMRLGPHPHASDASGLATRQPFFQWAWGPTPTPPTLRGSLRGNSSSSGRGAPPPRLGRFGARYARSLAESVGRNVSVRVEVAGRLEESLRNDEKA